MVFLETSCFKALRKQRKLLDKLIKFLVEIIKLGFPTTSYSALYHFKICIILVLFVN